MQKVQKNRSRLCFLLLSFSLLMLSGCKVNYSFTGASIAPDVKTVSVQYFKNNASLAPPTLSQTFTEALKDIFIAQTSLGVVPRDGDLSFEGEITQYMTMPVAIQANSDQAALNRLTITVAVRFKNAKDEKQKFETSFSRYADYASSQNLNAVQNQLIEEINQQLVQDIFNKAVINW